MNSPGASGDAREPAAARREIRSFLRRPTRERLRRLKTYRALRRSGRFDRDYYLATYPDVADSGIDPLMHYVEHGARHGYDPSVEFSTSDYLAVRPDVARAGMNPLLHDVRYGRGHGRGLGSLLRIGARRARAFARRLVPEGKALRREGSAATRFVRRYSQAMPTSLDVGAPEARDESVPVDRRGVLVMPRGQPEARPSVDVVVCVHDAVGDLRRCLRSLVEKTGRAFHLILVDDGSGPEAHSFLRRFVEANPRATLVTRDEPPHGYTLAANEGVRVSSGDYVVLLNSDTIVTFGWLDRIIACGESDSAIGMIGPLSNAATHQSVPELRTSGAWAVNELPGFLTTDGLAALLDGSAPPYPRLPFINGFCYAVKREVIDLIGLFDEDNFASGYCEENDYSYRASQEGFGLAVAADAYVFHAKSRSYGQEGRKQIARRNYQTFLQKHGEENINPLVARLERETGLERVRELVAEATTNADAFATAFRRACPHPLRVAFVLHGIGRGAAGGVHSIYQETRGMRALGIDARVVVPSESLGNARRLYADADEVFTGFRDEEDLHHRTEDRDVMVATHFRSVASVRALRERRDDFLAAYYVQDYEPFFFDTSSTEGREALESYDALPDGLVFAKTRWLCDLVSGIHDRYVAKVEPSIDHAVYRPRAHPRASGRDAVRVLGMVRPRTWRRQPLGTLRILDRLQAELGDRVEVRAFGCEEHELRALSARRGGRVENLGSLTREGVADALANADVFLDFSTYQAFGRTALEAMACGSTAVVPRVGGTSEYAVHGENAVVIDTSSEDAAFGAIAELVREPEALWSLQRGAVETAARFSVPRAALSEYLLFADEHAHRLRGPGVESGRAA